MLTERANIAAKSSRKDLICFSKRLYRAHSCVEWFFPKIKHYMRVGALFD